ncbi:type IV conjugative transfer system protein TraV [Gibbsiella quercinecans]|uniref:type IV conjugative transfer system lipoprotein TraV n=1 Tax=Gibbsiella quercinecans TaxID=929813 RepID=UPI000EF1F6D7|nr:type IV conjugative transfer system lipoprotein TraV [Gibbsiella quercinecans]RLM11803.1 type IV conjugative transfer system protein TraV [Gibbsiella quercinecans]
MKELMLLIPLGSALLLTGCAGTETEFECNATTSDTCMTMEQANEKAKAREESASAKPVAAGLPRLAEGNFRTSSPVSYPLPSQPDLTRARVVGDKERARAVFLNNPTENNAAAYFETEKRMLSLPVVKMSLPVVASTFTSPSTLPGNYPQPLRKGEQTASLWIAPYIDSEDVYHQPTTVSFVVTPSAWGQPRIN